jgi:hypothetical protein
VVAYKDDRKAKTAERKVELSVIGNTATYDKHPSVSFKAIGDSVGGRIVDFEEYQEQDFYSKEPKFFDNPGPDGKPQPIMGIRITLEQNPGDTSSRVTLWAKGGKMLKAIAMVVKAAGATDLEVGADLAVTFTGYDGRAKTFQAAYARPEAEAA